MRRSDREVTDFSNMLEIVSRCDCCRLGFVDGGMAYIVPMNFGFEENNGSLVLYFHSAADGKKIELIKGNSSVSFEMDTDHSLVSGETACNYTYGYACVMGAGNAHFIDNDELKARALGIIMSHYTAKKEWDFNARMLKNTAVIQLDITQWSCKEHKIEPKAYDKKELLGNIDKIHTTESGEERVRKNLRLGSETKSVIDWCKKKIKDPNAQIKREGKNWYITVCGSVITVNAYSYTIITAHKYRD